MDVLRHYCWSTSISKAGDLSHPWSSRSLARFAFTSGCLFDGLFRLEVLLLLIIGASRTHWRKVRVTISINIILTVIRLLCSKTSNKMEKCKCSTFIYYKHGNSALSSWNFMAWQNPFREVTAKCDRFYVCWTHFLPLRVTISSLVWICPELSDVMITSFTADLLVWAPFCGPFLRKLSNLFYKHNKASQFSQRLVLGIA